jgi:hypothetical protein
MFLNFIAMFSNTSVCQGQFWILPFMLISLIEQQNRETPDDTTLPAT